MTIKANINEVDYLINEVSKMNMFVVSEVNLIKKFQVVVG
jgi:wobble nucleotide-excising tRNase